ncbi:Virus X resistance protein-like, coiled-coil domain [Sesbania bispinosa]|nr:Virus X resistance protein-like, coiled-coil domain [Sesbania bispinosa]
MWDTILSCVRDHLLPMAQDHLLPLLMEASDMIRGFPKEVAELKDELEQIQSSIHEAVRMAAIDEEDNKHVRIKKIRLVKQLMEVAFRMEDAIDEYINHEEQEPRDLGCAALPCEAADFIKTMSLRLQISYKIHPTAQLIGWLENGKGERTVISVVGMGGQGKTTLVRKIFGNKKVIAPFDCCAWIIVSRSYDAERLLRDMLQKFYKYRNESPPHGISTMDREPLIEEVGNYLREKRYVVFFDDVWHTQFWEEIEFAVIDNKIGSRILITTRNLDVAKSCMKSSLVKVHQLQPLTLEKSLELFYKTTFRNLNGRCPKELVNISSKIVEKCKGLPLAIVSIGGVLSGRNRDSFEWKKFSQNLSVKLEKNSRLDVMGKLLGFSYDDLSYYLKSCFLYFGMYPEDYEVRSKRLIRHWIAEGFVKEEIGKNTLEDVAEGYLIELISRNLVQVSSVYIEGKVKACRVHDLLREMILRKCKDLSFCHYVSEDDQSKSSLSGISRRLSIATTSRDLTRNIESSPIRSLLFYTYREIAVPENHVKRISTKYMLKVLDFEDARLKHVPQNLGNLIHLKYLSFKHNGEIEILPKSIGKLQNLETLNIYGTRVCEMPKEISNLKKLRDLLIDFESLKDCCIGGMESLQMLSVVQINDEDGRELIRELGMLRQLRELGLRLSLSAMLNKLPEWIPKLENLVKLTLKWSNLADDPLKSLQNMPILLSLDIWYHGYTGKSMHFQYGGFKKLKRLHLKRLENLNSIIIDGGTLQYLEMFFLSEILQLKILTGIQHLKKLEHLLIDRMPPNIEQSITLHAQGHQIIKHVPLIQIENYYERITYRLGEVVQRSKIALDI